MRIRASSWVASLLACGVAAALLAVAPPVVGQAAADEALPSGGELLGWGENSRGELGTSRTATPSAAVPTQFISFDDVIDVSSDQHTLILRADGSVWATGRNDYDQSALQYSCAVSDSCEPVEVTQLPDDIVDVEVGGQHSLALTSDGEVWAWGRNQCGQLGRGFASTTRVSFPQQVTGLSGVADIAADRWHSLALLDDGTLVEWGETLGGSANCVPTTTPVAVPGLANVVEISTGEFHSLAVDDSGVVWGWGSNSSSALADVVPATTTTPVVLPFSAAIDVEAGFASTSVLTSTGMVEFVGFNNRNGISGNGSDAVVISQPVTASGLTGIIQIATGPNQVFALDGDGAVFAWGLNDSRGSLGLGIPQDQQLYVRTPQVVPAPLDVIDISDGHLIADDAGGSPGSCNGVPLVECYAPEVRFHPDEEFFPMDPDDFVEGSLLRWAADVGCPNLPVSNKVTLSEVVTSQGLALLQYEGVERSGLLCRGTGRVYRTNEFTRPFDEVPTNGARALRVLGDSASGILDVNEGFYLDWNQDAPPTGTVVGGRVVAPMFADVFDGSEFDEIPNDERWIIYQFFYGNDPKSPPTSNPLSTLDDFVEHEGDWERIDVVLDTNDEPLRVQYHGHSCEPREVDWFGDIDLEKVEGTHPVGYVSLGSHASYPSTDLSVLEISSRCPNVQGQADDTELTDESVSWQSWLDVRNPANECWFQFGGAWGDTGNQPFKSDATGPAGPPFKIDQREFTGPGDACQPGVRVARDYEGGKLFWEGPTDVTVEGPAGTGLFVFMRSVPTPIAEATIPASGTLTIPINVPASTSPGIHQLVVADRSTGQEYYVGEFIVEVPAGCDAAETLEADLDGDDVSDSCDTNPFDGPLADADFDLVPNGIDNCVLVPNPGQERIGDRDSGTACDPRSGFNPIPTIIPISEYLLPPSAVEDNFIVDASTTTALDVVANDVETDNPMDVSSLIIVSSPALGQAVVANGAIEYTAGTVSGIDVVEYAICDTTGRCAIGSATITVEANVPTVCTAMVIDSFQAAPWTFTFQVRNSSDSPVDFEFIIPDANYELTNLQFNGSGQNVTLTQSANGDGTFDLTIAGTVPAYQSVGGQQPNGFGGALSPTNGAPIVLCGQP